MTSFKAVATLALLAFSGLHPARAQLLAPARISVLDVAAQVGVSHTSRWFDDASGSDAGRAKRGIVAGVALTYWLTPRLGVRADGARLRTRLERAGDGDFVHPDSRVDLGLYSVGLEYRALRRSAPFALLYAFAGAGVIRAAVRDRSSDSTAFTAPRRFTTPQAAFGAGATLVNVTDRVAVFAEAAGHVYRPSGDVESPASASASTAAMRRVAGTVAAASGTGRLALTSRLGLGAKLLVGNSIPPSPLPPPPPPVPIGLDTVAASGVDESAPGTIVVTVPVPGAEVFTIRLSATLGRHGVFCRLDPVESNPLATFEGYVPQTGERVFSAPPTALYVIVQRRVAGRVLQARTLVPVGSGRRHLVRFGIADIVLPACPPPSPPPSPPDEEADHDLVEIVPLELAGTGGSADDHPRPAILRGP